VGAEAIDLVKGLERRQPAQDVKEIRRKSAVSETSVQIERKGWARWLRLAAAAPELGKQGAQGVALF